MKRFFISVWSWIRGKGWTTSQGPAVGQSTDAGKASKTVHPECPPDLGKPVMPKNPVVETVKVATMNKVTKTDGSQEDVLKTEQRKVVKTETDKGVPVTVDVTDEPIGKHDKFAPTGKEETTSVPKKPSTEPKPHPKTEEIIKNVDEVKNESKPKLKKQWAAAPTGGKFKNGKMKKPLTARQVYELRWGKTPKGKVVYHMDGDETNFHISNLGTITRSDLMKKNLHGE